MWKNMGCKLWQVTIGASRKSRYRGPLGPTLSYVSHAPPFHFESMHFSSRFEVPRRMPLVPLQVWNTAINVR
jgi:hypothetical protein